MKNESDKASGSEPAIKELIVVEGKNDAHVIRQAFGRVDVIWTEGFGLTEEKIKLIAHMAERQGVIVCTDPDFAGEQIRKRISKRVPTAHHVFLARSSALNGKGDDIGWENASADEIRKAFANVLKDTACQHLRREQTEDVTPIQMIDLLEAGLVGQEGSAARRSQVGKYLGIGDANAKQFLYRANRFGLDLKDFMEALNCTVKVE